METGRLSRGAIYLAAFLQMFGLGLLKPSLPLYMDRVFGAEVFTILLVPAIFALGKIGANLSSGPLFSPKRRRWMLASGLLLLAAADLLSPAAADTTGFLATRALAGAGYGAFMTTATSVLVSDRTTRIGSAVSWLLIWEACGHALGSLPGGWLLEHAGAASPFWAKAGISLASVGVVFFVGSGRADPIPAAGTWVRSDVRHHCMRICPAGFAMGLFTSAAIGPMLALFLVRDRGLSVTLSGVCYSVLAVGQVLAMMVTARCLGKRNWNWILVGGLVATAVFLAVKTLPLIVGSVFLVGLFSGLSAPVSAASIGFELDPAVRGRAVGLLRTSVDGSLLIRPVAMAALAQGCGLAAGFLAAAALMMLSAVPVLALAKREKSGE